MPRLAVIRFSHEGNSFNPVLTDRDAFERTEWLKGEAAREAYRGTRTEMGAAVAFLDANPDWEGIFLRCAAAPPGGPASDLLISETITEVSNDLADGKWDAVYVSLHGAMIGKKREAPDLDMLRAVRGAASSRCKIAASFDMHANMSWEIGGTVDIAVGYKTYPHVDAFETAAKALGLLTRTAAGEIQPMVMVERTGLVLPSHNMRTDSGPMAEIEAAAREMVDEIHLKLKAEELESARDKLSEAFAQPDPFRSIETIGAKVAGELRDKARLAMFVALIAIVFYIWFRFGEVKFGIAAIVALAHDVLMVMGGVAIADALSDTRVGEVLMFKDIKINLQMIAAFLTIIGYSLNDTIVVFDRIRENMGGSRRHIGPEVIDASVNQTLSRTLLTSLTTLMVVAVLYVVGGPVIHGFAFALLLGVAVGTYSSIFIASPILIDWDPAMKTLGRLMSFSRK